MTPRVNRYATLDGLRGLAALAVVISHVLMTQPVFVSEVEPSAVEWALMWTPLRIFWEGTAAVVVFFVLSGFVLALPSGTTRSGWWRGYYPSRLLRLLVPVWVALGFTGLLMLVVPRTPVPGLSWWGEAHFGPFGVGDWVGAATLIEAGFINSVLWTLEYEVLFSLLLPLYLLLGRGATTSRRALLGIAACVVLTKVGTVLDQRMLIFMPMFAVGVLMARQVDAFERWAERVPRGGQPVLLGVAVLALTCRWLPAPFSAPGLAGMLAGAALLVWLFLTWRPAQRLALVPGVQWLGALSFSLYLVHEPILVSLVLAAPELDVVVLLGVTLVCAVGVAWLFMVLCERPVQRGARRLRRALDPGTDRRLPAGV